MLPEQVGAGARTVFHVAEGATGTGSRSDPASIETIQYWLGAVVEYASGLTILFRRGDKWTYKDDAYDPLSSPPGSLLTIRASGTEGRPIYIGAYTDPDNPSQVPPKFFGDGDVELTGCSTSACTITRGTRFGIRISGGRYIQLQDLQITNFGTGVSVASFYDGRVISSGKGTGTLKPGYPTRPYPVRGSRHVTLRQLEVYENWRDGISISSDIGTFTERYFDNVLAPGTSLSNTEVAVVGDGKVYLKLEDVKTGSIVLREVPVDDRWWVEEVCVENCKVFANGDGACSAGGNISLLSLASRCTFRHNEIYGAVHSRRWPNACGQVVLEYVDETTCSSTPAAPNVKCLWDRAAVDPDFLVTWGTDGITFSGGGCGNIIENNIIRDHIVGQSSDGSCGQDDGNGIDIKGSGNRTYWQNMPGGERVLRDMPNVIRNNVLTRNAEAAIILHYGCKNIHVYNNEIAYNYGRALEVAAGALEGAQWKSEMTLTADAGPALMQDIFIYRNMIYKNGYIIFNGTDMTYEVYIEATLGICSSLDGRHFGRTAIYITEAFSTTEVDYHGSIDNIMIVNNTVADNYWYGLTVELSYDSTLTNLIDNDDYHVSNVAIVNNIFSGNTGNSFNGVQVRISDQLSSSGYGYRGFLCSMDISNNCYYNPQGTKSDVVSYQSNNLQLSSFSGLSETFILYVSYLPVLCTAGPFGSGSIDAEPLFVNPGRNNYKLLFYPEFNIISPCVNQGVDVDDLLHYETGMPATMGPDYEFEFNLTIQTPDMGADEVGAETSVSDNYVVNN